MTTFGDTIDELAIGRVRVVVRYGCVRRDHYELVIAGPVPTTLRERLGSQGELRGSAELYVVDVPRTYVVTVAARKGRIVVMPRLTSPRAKQRESVTLLAGLLDSLINER